MLNPIVSQDSQAISYEEHASVAERKNVSIGDVICCTAHGKVGHNYARWEVVAINKNGGCDKLPTWLINAKRV